MGPLSILKGEKANKAEESGGMVNIRHLVVVERRVMWALTSASSFSKRYTARLIDKTSD